MASLIERLNGWRSMKQPISRWRRRARSTMDVAIQELLLSREKIDEASVLATIDDAYPFGERSRHPYKAWLTERRLLADQMMKSEPVSVGPTAEDAAACEVAIDLIEMDRIDEAKELLDKQAPGRHANRCPVCNARPGEPCRDYELKSRPLRPTYMYPGTTKESWPKEEHNHVAVKRLVPHLARVIAASGPLFGEAR
jgi:hypothetical protein